MTAVSHTLITDNTPELLPCYTGTKSFHSKQLLARFAALEEAKDAIVDIIVLSGSHKEEVPPRYKRLP